MVAWVMLELKDAITAIGMATSSTIVMGGWFIAHYFSSKRDLANERRKLRLNYLGGVWHTICNCSQKEASLDEFKSLEAAISDIQIFGSASQVALAREVCDEIAKSGTTQMDLLLSDLRNSLRAELDLEPLPVGLFFLRWSTREK